MARADGWQERAEVGAEAGTRTPMALRPLAPEASASANSATSASGAFRRAAGNSKYNLAGVPDRPGPNAWTPRSLMAQAYSSRLSPTSLAVGAVVLAAIVLSA